MPVVNTLTIQKKIVTSGTLRTALWSMRCRWRASEPRAKAEPVLAGAETAVCVGWRRVGWRRVGWRRVGWRNVGCLCMTTDERLCRMGSRPPCERTAVMKLDRHYTDPRLVELYDLENPRGVDTDFYIRLAAELDAHRILDLGCGTGLLT